MGEVVEFAKRKGEVEIECCGVLQEYIDDMWPYVEKHLARGLEHSFGELDLNDIREGLDNRTMQLWVAIDMESRDFVAALVTEIIEYPKIKACRMIVVGGGHMKHWLQYQTELMKWAKDIGCDRIEGLCRDGWTRTLEKYGYEKLYNLVAVDLHGEVH